MPKSTNVTLNSVSRRKKRRTNATTQNDTAVSELKHFVMELYCDGRCGCAAAEYNLVKAGAIEVASKHVPGHLREDQTFFFDSKWKLTELGERAGTAPLTSIILQDAPLEIALWDAMSEARNVSRNCGGCEPNDPFLLQRRRMLAHLLERVDRVRAAGRY
jgi:hypothetical protein